MPISRIIFRDGRADDVHLIWGDTSRNFFADGVNVLEVLPSGEEKWVRASAYARGDVDIEFIPVFLAVPTATHYEAFGIRVEKKTGVVSFTAPSRPPNAPHNFIVEAVVTRNVGGIDGALITRAPIRVHVHPGTRRLWMTPNPMTVRRLTAAGENIPDSRFTLRAEFTDDTVGDITEEHGVVWSPSDSAVDTGEGGGRLTIRAGDLPGSTIEITATWKGLSAKGNMVIAPPWANEPAMPKADLVDGAPDTWAGTINPHVVPNVLIMGDGLVKNGSDDDVAKLKPIAQLIVHHMKTDLLTRPYDLLATSMNFWCVAVPAPARGASVRCEVYTLVENGRMVARPVPPGRPPLPDRGWSLETVIYAVGLPVPGDELIPETLLRTNWVVTTRDEAPGLGDFRTLPDRWTQIVGAWKDLVTRTFIDEVDGFPAMALGNPPSASEKSSTPYLKLHSERGAPQSMRTFFQALRASNNVTLDGPVATNALGNVWAADNPAFRFDSRSLVVVLSAINGGRAQRVGVLPNIPLEFQSPHIALSIDARTGAIPVRPVAGRRAVEFHFIDPIPETVSRDVWRTMAHEMGHSFGLGDEYVDLPGRFAGPETSLDGYANLTSEAAVTQAGAITAASIKWNWHRARTAAVVAKTPTLAGGTLSVPLLDTAGFQFAVGDPVFLRRRKWKDVIGRAPVTSPLLQVLSRDPSGDSVTLSGAPAGFDPTPFADGSVLYVPVRDPAQPSAFFTLVAPKIAKFINDNRRPLSAWPCGLNDQLGRDAEGKSLGEKTQVPEYDGYDGFWSHRNDTRTIGLYSGGIHQGCGVFHPAGQCMMRNSDLEVVQFCHVCRFALVESINARWHFEIDRDYDVMYPK